MKIVVLTGAGISAESGVPVFRGADGLWEGHRVEDVATPEGFSANPGLVHQFYNKRRRFLLDDVEPNEAHKALAKLEDRIDGKLVVVTQNIDNLHERAGSTNVLHMHGELLKSRCTSCGDITRCWEDTSDESRCDVCGGSGTLRPHVVWFGEMPFHLHEIGLAIRDADLFVAIGTSGRVYPAAGFVTMARDAGVRTLEINLDPAETSGIFDETRRGPAGELVPAWVDEILAGGRSPGSDQG